MVLVNGHLMMAKKKVDKNENENENVNYTQVNRKKTITGVFPTCGDNSGKIGFFFTDGIGGNIVCIGNFNFGCNVDIVDIDCNVCCCCCFND
ncbi:hypothetical protein DERF_002439 [Dermatophagoides farinae]|uniref:Uncharacterized protein n=1 Tax=Dermatophagoides farinae TaxID=6954 RepID=A0A922IBJ9_DERFA|nr:hypothetical protein DERF_002439 [Dermatophagoides farinae]